MSLREKFAAWLRSPFMRGFGSVLDLSGSLPRDKRDVHIKTDAEAWEADQRALRGDWERVFSCLCSTDTGFDYQSNVKCLGCGRCLRCGSEYWPHDCVKNGPKGQKGPTGPYSKG